MPLVDNDQKLNNRNAMPLRIFLLLLMPNGALALVAFIVMPHKFTDSVGTCYWVAAIAVFSGIVSVAAIVRRQIDARPAVALLIGQAVALIFVFAGIYRGFGINSGQGLPNIEPLVDFETALYFSVVTWTTLGYGDLAPAQGLQLLAALEAALGYIFLGLIVGLTANLIIGGPAAQERLAGQQNHHNDKRRTGDEPGTDPQDGP